MDSIETSLLDKINKYFWGLAAGISLLVSVCGCENLDQVKTSPHSYQKSQTYQKSRIDREKSFDELDMGKRLWAETNDTFGDKDNLTSLGIITVGSYGLMETVDEPINDYFEGDKPLEDLEPIGDFAGYALPVGLMLGPRIYGEIYDDEEMIKTSKAMTDAGLLTFLYGETLVTGFGRERPRKEEGATSFKPFSQPGNMSFPAIHPAVVNAQLKVLRRMYPDNEIIKYGRPLVVGSIAYLRMEKQSHWLSDIPLGIVLSEIVGNEVADRYLDEETEQDWYILPFTDNDCYGVAYQVEF